MPRINTWIFGLLASVCCALPVWAGDMPLATLQTLPAQAFPAIEMQGEKAKEPVETGKAPLTAVHFWASWCVPCVKELPEVSAAQKAFGARGLKIVAISLDTNMEKVRAFFVGHHIDNLNSGLDMNTGAFRALQVKGLPATVFFNGEGKAIARADGPLDWKSPAVMSFIETNLKK